MLSGSTGSLKSSQGLFFPSLMENDFFDMSAKELFSVAIVPGRYFPEFDLDLCS